MTLKNRVALYDMLKKEKLTYNEVVEKMNWKHWLYVKLTEKGKEPIFIKIPDNATFRDIEMFAKGIEIAKNKECIERTNYICQ